MISSSNVASLIGATVRDSDGDKIGTVGQIFVDPTSGEPNWASVRTGLFGTSESFVPLSDASEVEGDVTVPYEKDFVKDAPRIDADGSIEQREEDALYSYYNNGGSIQPPASTDRDDSTETVTDSDLAYDAPGYDDAASDSAAAETTTGFDATSEQDGTFATAPTDADVETSTGFAAAGSDTSGPSTDDAMTRSEEQLHVGTETVESGRARLRKYVVTEEQTVTVPVSHEEVRLEREPITDGNVGAALDGADISEEEHEVILTEERPVVQKETVPVERVRLGTETVTDQQQVTEEVRKEQIEFDDDSREGVARP